MAAWTSLPGRRGGSTADGTSFLVVAREWPPLAIAADDRWVGALGGELFRHATAPRLAELLQGFRKALSLDADLVQDRAAAERIAA